MTDRQYGWVDENGQIHHLLENVIYVNFEESVETMERRIAAAYSNSGNGRYSDDLLRRAQAARERSSEKP